MSIVVGALALGASGGQSHYVAFGLVVCVGGALLVLVAVAALRIGRMGWLVTIGLTLAGLFFSLLVAREDVCCMYGYHRGLGYPWGWLDSYIVAEDMAVIDAARSDPAVLEKKVDWLKVVLDGLFWLHVALLFVVPVTWLHRYVQARPKAQPPVP
ncbi:hypothetical protein [Sphaerimonospora mesophila]|uniref:hypothetical protein n=1 Tax=Sphaerimonospora mesophila TaxID=37483 RepID=UPI00128EDFD0